MSEPKEKAKGIFGRLFKGGSVSPSEEAEKAMEAEIPAVEEIAKAEPSKQSWFQRLKSGLGKTSSKLTSGITDLFPSGNLMPARSTTLKIC